MVMNTIIHLDNHRRHKGKKELDNTQNDVPFHFFLLDVCCFLTATPPRHIFGAAAQEYYGNDEAVFSQEQLKNCRCTMNDLKEVMISCQRRGDPVHPFTCESAGSCCETAA
jgi:hypothetical protein